MEETAPRDVALNPDTSLRRRSLLAGCSAHAVHDGLTDVIYVLLPLWQAQFGLSLAQAQVAVEAAVEECDRFYPAFQFVLWGDKTPAEALASAMVDAAGEA